MKTRTFDKFEEMDLKEHNELRAVTHSPSSAPSTSRLPYVQDESSTNHPVYQQVFCSKRLTLVNLPLRHFPLIVHSVPLSTAIAAS